MLKKSSLIRSQRLIVVISALTLLFTVLVVMQVGLNKSEQMLIEKTSGLISVSLDKNEMGISDMLYTARKLSAATSTNKTISELLLQAINATEQSGVKKTVNTYSSEDMRRIRQIESILTNYRNTFFDHQVHSVILGSDGSMYSVLDGVDNSSLFGTNFAASIATQDWYRRFLASPEGSMWAAPCSYSKTGNFYTLGNEPEDADRYLIFVRKMHDFTTQKELGVSVVSLPAGNLKKLLAPDPSAGIGLLNEQNKLIYSSVGDWGDLFEQFANDWKAPAEAENRGYVKTRLGGADYLVNYITLSATGWKMVNIIPYGLAVSEIMDLRRYIYLFSIAITICAIAICTAMLIYMTDPLNRLFQRMGEMQIGNRQVGGNEPVTRIHNVSEAETQLNHMLDRIEQLSQAALEQQKLEQNLQFEMLRAQLNPHFLLNTLNTIKWSAMVSGASNIAGMISALGRLLESSMRRGEETVTLKEELELVQTYMQIKNWTLKYRIALHINVAEDLYTYKVFRYCLQPLVENAVIHGIDGMENAEVSVHGRHDTADVWLEVVDNGRGITEEQIVKVLNGSRAPHQISGVGLSSVNGMIRLRYGDQYGLSIQSVLGNGTTVRIRLPYQNEEEELSNAADIDCR